MRQHLEKWKRADEFARAVAACIEREILAAGLTPRDIGGEALEDSITYKDAPLRMSQLELIAIRLERHPREWLRRDAS